MVVRFSLTNPRIDRPEWCGFPAGDSRWERTDRVASPTKVRSTRLSSMDSGWTRRRVTNRQFAEFADATGYVSLAEKPPSVEALRRTPGYENAEIKPEFNKRVRSAIGGRRGT